MPGTDPVTTLNEVLAVLADPHVPFLPELPDRGVGADTVGRGASILVELPVDLQPSGWRLVDRPGRDLARARSWLRQDLDVLAERAEGLAGPLLITAPGPWSLAAAVQRPRGGAVAGDTGARRDVVDSLAQGIGDLVRAVLAAVPGARPVVQLDEPSLPSVLAGRVPRESGLGTLAPVDLPEVEAGLGAVLAGARAAGAVATAVHCCSPDAPVDLLSRCGADVLGVDVSGDLGPDGLPPGRRAFWDSVVLAVESGRTPAFGVVDPRAVPRGPGRDAAVAIATRLATIWSETGMAATSLAPAALTPACGLVAAGPAALTALRVCVAAAEALDDAVQGAS